VNEFIFLEEITKDQSFKEFIHIPQDEYKQLNSNIPPEWLCPKCGQGRLRKITNGPYGAFLGCSRYPNCKYTKNLKRR
jgi:DNA helicase-4